MMFQHWSRLAIAGFAAALLCCPSPALAQARLGTAASFSILAGTPDVTNTGPSVIIGDLGIHPAIAVSGFPPGTVIGAIHPGDGVALQAKNDLTNAYTVLAGEPCPPLHALGPALVGLTLTPGVYCFTSAALLAVNGTLTLDAQGDPNAEFIFQVGSQLTVQSGATVRMINGGSFCNVYWQVGSSASLGTSVNFIGNIVALTSVTLDTGANVFGRALARNGTVTLDNNHISNGGCVGAAAVATPTLAKEFNPATINVGDVSTLTITLSNANSSPATGAAFTDTLPGGVKIAASPSATNDCGGVLVATAGNSTLTLTGGTIPGGTPFGTCTVTVPVTATTTGSHLNTLPIGALTSSNGNNATEASATLTVPAPGEVTIGKAFSPASIIAGGQSTLTITLSNANSSPATGAAFTDTLPGGVKIAASPSATNDCGGVLVATAGNSTLTLTGGTVPGGTPFGTCTVTVRVTATTTGSFLNTQPIGALTSSNGNNATEASATLTVVRPLTLIDSQGPGSVIVFPKFIRGTVSVDGVVTPRTEIGVGVVCPRDVICPEGQKVKIRFHWVCGTDENPLTSFICKERDFELITTVNGKLVFNTEGTTSPGNAIAATPPCQRGYLIGWVEDFSDRPIKFDGLIGDAVLRESGTAVAAYTGITIQADPALANNALITLPSTNGAFSLPFDGLPGHYQAVTGVIYTDVEYDKPTAPSHTTYLTLLTLDTHSNRPNFPVFVDLDFYSAQELLFSTSTNFICWEEIAILDIDEDLTAGSVGSRKGVLVSHPAVKSPISGINDTAGPVTLLGLVETLEGPTAAPPVGGNERAWMHGVSNNGIAVPTQFYPSSLVGPAGLVAAP